jgi:tetratricopeptide (TPR) repeat protein
MNRKIATLLILATAAGCAGKRIAGLDEMQTEQGRPGGSATSQQDAAAAAARQADAVRAEIAQQANAASAEATATCTPAICAAIGRHEMALGMSQAQVFAATQTIAGAWDIRGTPTNGTMISSTTGRTMIKDRIGEVTMVTIRDGKTVGYVYREPAGLRAVTSPEDATTEGRRKALALSLLNQGDELMSVGQKDKALERYDQADVINPNDPATTLRIARIIDQQNRPIEALMRYQKFLHEMDIERINAKGKANAELAGAITMAQHRIVTLQEIIKK